MRLFAAIRPPAEVLDHLELPLTNLRLGAGAPLRWVPPDQQHLTLAFYGEIPDGAADAAADSLAEAAARHAPLDLRLRGAGSFTGRTLWVGVGGDTDPLAALMSDVAGAPYEPEHDADEDEEHDDEPGRPGGAPARGRPNGSRPNGSRSNGSRPNGSRSSRGRSAHAGQDRRRAHLTVARESRRSRGTDLAGLASALAIYEGPTWRADVVELVSSHLGEGRGGGPRHEAIATLPLTGSA
ncbi:2'-5' RNA ligase family protein [Georgenia sp. Z1344]|uniref:2'-5' RNA ligase family protein n=1 Tax=Georgenia sp. Z1344 TaxID=3416706 RepID=UPI003CE9B1D8